MKFSPKNKNITSLSLEEIPSETTILDLSGCTQLTKLPEKLPDSLTKLDLSGCTGLPNSPGLIAQLEALEEKNKGNPDFRLIWPSHIDRNVKVGEIKKSLV